MNVRQVEANSGEVSRSVGFDMLNGGSMPLKNAVKSPECPQCGSKDTGCENRGEWYCYSCGNQWEQVRGERT